MKTIMILMDTLNRHMLSLYNPGTQVRTPNMNRLASQSVVFDNHWSGSLPCMPARRELMTGRYNFLERNWGPVEPFDKTLPMMLKERNVFSHIITDHPHYFETGGENYCQQFNTWDFHRGQEVDPWVSRVADPVMPEQSYGKVSRQYEWNRTQFIEDKDFSSPRTFAAACQWLEDNKDADDYFLWVEAFDPHEPFDCTQEFLDMYDDDYQGPRYDWPIYGSLDADKDSLDSQAHMRKRYAATLTMADKWLGKLLDKLDETDGWKDTLIILTTDHGFLLNEHDLIGKNVCHAYNELVHIPLIVHLPGGEYAGERVQALTQTLDLMPTLLDYYDMEIPSHIHGKSMKALLEKSQTKIREWALYGYFGRTVNITDGRYTYFHAPLEENQPCYSYCAIPTSLWKFMGTEQSSAIEMGRFLKHTEYPVYKISMGGGNLALIKESQLFDIETDYVQKSPLKDEALQLKYRNLLILAMKEADAPEEQFIRLGLSEVDYN